MSCLTLSDKMWDMNGRGTESNDSLGGQDTRTEATPDSEGQTIPSRFQNFATSHPYLTQFLISLAIGTIFVIGDTIYKAHIGQFRLRTAEDILVPFIILAFLIGVVAMLLVYPVIVAGFQLLLTVQALRWRTPQHHRPGYDTWTLGYLLMCQVLYLATAKHVEFFASWDTQLTNDATHPPFAPEYGLFLFILLALCLVAFFVLWLNPADDLPPLAVVASMAMLYITTGYVILWTIQIFNPSQLLHPAQLLQPTRLLDLYLLIPGAVFCLIVLRTITVVIRSYTPDVNRRSKIDAIPLLGALNRLLSDAKAWPIAAFVATLPLLGLAFLVLLAFGQGPHALIRAFTDTSSWALSQQQSPPNLLIDEHYLCTVAASGHKQLVKPLRGGVRHGHAVVVNRQLLVANAFEQVLSDRLPYAHRAIRAFYDKYGFDLAKRIRTQWAADFVWLAMKPLEWVFLLVIYFTVRHPEDLIAMQYTGVWYRGLEDLAD